jgi:hypothetical protein
MESKPISDVRRFYYENAFQTPGVVVKRCCYEHLGGFLPRLTHTADWEMWMRVISSKGGLAINLALASYRWHAENDTHRLLRNGEELRDTLEAGMVFKKYLPGYDLPYFRSVLAGIAKGRASWFRRLGDMEAARANDAFWRQHANPKQKVKNLIRTLWAAVAQDPEKIFTDYIQATTNK